MLAVRQKTFKNGCLSICLMVVQIYLAFENIVVASPKIRDNLGRDWIAMFT